MLEKTEKISRQSGRDTPRNAREAEKARRAPFEGLSWRGVYGRSWKTFGKDLWNEMNEDDVVNGSATAAFYLTFAIFPALIFLLGLLPYLPIKNLQDAVMQAINEAMPGDSAKMLQSTVLGIVAQKHQSLLSLGAVLMLWSSSTGIYSLMQQLNYTYDVKESRPYWKTRVIALGLVVAFGFLTVLAFAVMMGGDAVDKRLTDVLPWWTGIIKVAYETVRWLFTLVALSGAFSLVFYFGPDVKQEFRFITPGSVLSVLLFVGASMLFKLYVTNLGNYNATYGSLGAFMVLMLWLNLVSFVTLLGSEVNALLEHYAPAGKEKGEKAPGEPQPQPATERKKTA